MFPVVIHPPRRHLRAFILHQRAKISKSVLFEQIQIFFRNHFAHRSPPRKITRKLSAQRGPSRFLLFIELPRVIVPQQTLPAPPGLRGTLRPRRCRQATGPFPCRSDRGQPWPATRRRRQPPSPPIHSPAPHT